VRWRVNGKSVLVHRVRSWRQDFGPLLEGKRRRDVRQGGHDYRVGDWVVFDEWDEWTGETGRNLTRRVGHLRVTGELVMIELEAGNPDWSLWEFRAGTPSREWEASE